MTGWCVLDCPFYLSQQQIFQLSHLIISSLFLHFHLKKLSRSRPQHLKMCTCAVTLTSLPTSFSLAKPKVKCSLFTSTGNVLLPLLLILPDAAPEPEEDLRDDHEQRDDDEDEGDHPGVPRGSVEQLGHPFRNWLECKSY